jgi:hypothetical protein
MQERGIPAGAWPGGYCNQADQPEAQNAELLQHEGKCTAPSYDWMDEQCHNLFVKLKRPVPAGEETDRLVIVTRIQDSYFISS